METKTVFEKEFWESYAELFHFHTFEHQKRLLEDASNYAIGKLVDLGGGVGKSIPYLEKNSNVSEILLVDGSEEMLKYVNRDFPLVQTKLEDVTKFPIQNGEFDTIFTMNCIYAINNPIKLIGNWASKLESGQKLILGNQGRELNTDPLMEAMFKEAKDLDKLKKYLKANKVLVGKNKLAPRTYGLEEICSIFEQNELEIEYSTNEHFYGSCPLVIGVKTSH